MTLEVRQRSRPMTNHNEQKALSFMSDDKEKKKSNKQPRKNVPYHVAEEILNRLRVKLSDGEIQRGIGLSENNIFHWKARQTVPEVAFMALKHLEYTLLGEKSSVLNLSVEQLDRLNSILGDHGKDYVLDQDLKDIRRQVIKALAEKFDA